MSRFIDKKKQGAYSPTVASRSVPANSPALARYCLYTEAKSLVTVTKTRKMYDVNLRTKIKIKQHNNKPSSISSDKGHLIFGILFLRK